MARRVRRRRTKGKAWRREGVRVCNRNLYKRYFREFIKTTPFKKAVREAWKAACAGRRSKRRRKKR